MKDRSAPIKALRVAGSVILSLILGSFGFSMLFSDLGSGETLVSRLMMTAMYFLLSGLLTGYFNPSAWLIAGIIGWGGVLLALQSLISGVLSEALVLVLASLVPALLGGYLGRSLGQKWPPGTVFRGWRRRQ